jgi:acetyl esterase/lipase
MSACGLVVMAVEFRKSPAHPYPAQVQDVNYATRWLKAHAAEFNGVAEAMGGLGTSSGGHTILLSCMRPNDSRYAALPLEGGEAYDSTLAYVLALWPVLDPYQRYFFAHETGMHNLVENAERYFQTYETIKEANPTLIVERGEPVRLPPVQIIQPGPDRNIPPSMPEHFVEVYKKAGGHVEMEWFPELEHGFARGESAETQRALALMKDFVARQLAATAKVH